MRPPYKRTPSEQRLLEFTSVVTGVAASLAGVVLLGEGIVPESMPVEVPLLSEFSEALSSVYIGLGATALAYGALTSVPLLARRISRTRPTQETE